MTETTQKQETATDQRSNKPTHRVTFRRKLKDGYAQAVTISGAWENSKGGISFPFAGGSLTIWPLTDQLIDDADAPAENSEAA